MTIEIVQSDVLEWAANYTGPKFHTLLCDPPYHLHDGNPNAKGGFMGKAFDGGDIAFDPATWAALAEHLHPGGFIMAFASSRGWHRLACAIEDAGLRIHPSIFGWAQGSGFPKATRIDTQIDKAAGAERVDLGPNPNKIGRTCDMRGGRLVGNGTANMELVCRSTAPATPLAAVWEGHRYGRQALKPALEPIIVAQKPYAGRPVDSITATGAGALNIDLARVPTGGEQPNGSGDRRNGNIYAQDEYTRTRMANGGNVTPPAGRWPPNLVISHLPPRPCPCAAYTPDAAPLAGCRACGGTGTVPGCERVGTRRVRGRNVETGATCENEHVCYSDNIGGRSTTTTTEAVAEYRCAPGCPVSRLDEAVGPLAAGGFPARRNVSGYSGGLDQGDTPHGAVKTDAGGPSRFFPTPDWSLDIAEALAAADPVCYAAKASRRERSAGLENYARDNETAIIAAWENEARGQPEQTDVTSPERDTCAGTSTGDCACSTSLNGNVSTGRSRQDSKSTTSTVTSSTIESRTSHLSPQPNTSASIADASCETANGGSPAESAGSSSQSPLTTGISPVKDGRNTGGVGPATSGECAKMGASVSYAGSPTRTPPSRNIHPCCKPLMLTRWLASLLLPPAAYAPRRILVPFAGSGSEMIGAMLAGWEEVIGVEAEAEYVEIARARLAWWAANRDKAPEVRAGSGTGQASYQPNGKNAVYGNGMGGGGNKNPYPRTNGHAPAAPPMLPGLEPEAAR